MTKAEERRLMLQNQKTTTNTSNNGGTSKAEQRRAMLKNVTNTAPINNTAQANAYNTLLNATNVSTYDEVQTKTTKKEKVLNSISNGQQYRVTGAKRVFNDINKGEQYNSEAKAYTKWATQPASDSVYRDYSLNNLDVSNLNKLNLKYYGQSGSTDENKNYLRDYIMLKRDLASGKLTSTYSKITGKEYTKIPTVDEYVKDVENYETEKDKTFSGKLENGVQGIGQAIKTMANATTSTVTNIYDSITKPDFNIPIDTKNITSYNPGYANMSLLQIAKETGDKELASKSNQANHAIGQLELWTKTYATKGEAKQVMDNLIAELKNGTYQGTDEDVKKTIEQVKTIIANENKTTWANDLYARTLEENEYRYSEPAKKFVNALGTATEQLPTLTMAVAGGAPASTFGIYSSAEGSAIKQALNEGATYEDARKYGMGVGLAETGIETLSGGVTNKVLGIPGFINMTSNITNPYVRGLINYTGDVLGESFEEGISGVIEPYIRKATYDPNAGFKNFGEALTAFTNNYVESILPTMLMSAGTNIVNTTQMARVKKDVDNYYNEFENVIKASNLTENQKQEAIREIEKTKKEVLKQAFNQDENLQNTTQSNTNLAQISPNNEQISQNNVQNVSNLENAAQNDVKALPSNNTVGNVSRQELLNMSNELQHKGEVFVDDRFAKALKSDSNIVKLENVVLKTNKLSELRKLAKNLTNKFIDSKVKNSDTNMDVTIGKKGIKETVSKDLNQDKIESIQELPKLIEEAVYKNSSIDIDEKNNIYHYLVSLAENGNSEKILNYITLKETPNNIKFHYNTTEKIEDSPMSSRSGNNAEHVIPTSDEPSVNNIIPNSQNYVNNQQINLPTQAQQQAEQEAKRSRIPKLEDIADLTQKDADLPSMKYKANKDKNTAFQRKFFENMETSKIISDKVKEQVTMTTYEQKKNLETLEKVKENLDTDINKVASEWFRKDIKKATDEDVALGAILVERYQQEGMFEEAVDVVQKLADMGTEAGRTVQMYSIFQRLTPEGMMVYQQRKLNGALETLTQKQTGKWVEQNKDKFKLTEDDATFITAKVQEAQNAPTERQKQIALAEIETRINDKLPPEAGQSVKAFRRISMLFNPKTQVRNIMGNVTVMPLNYVTDLVATSIDKAISKKTGVRTTTIPNLKTIGKGFVKGASETIDDYRRGIRTSPTGSRYEIQNQAKDFNENTNSKVKNAINKKLNGIDRVLSMVLEVGDRPFYEAAYQNSLETQMKANKVTEPTQEMIDIASNVALSQTWQDNNNYTQAVLGIRSAFNKININGFGLGDLIIPFAKTPANLTKAMVDYSPAGFIPSLINYNDMRKAISRGDMTAMQQKKFVTSVGKAVAGTILYTIAGVLVKGGAVTGSADEDKDVANFEMNVLGIQPYSIKIGDKTFTYNWANPIATPFAIMADTYKMSEEGAKWNEILVNAFKVAGDQLVANSFLQGIQELLSSEYGNESAMDNLVGAIMDLPTQFTPTLFGQIATQFDSTKRQTFENGDTVGTMWNEVKNKLPGARNTLAPQVNTFGKEIQNYGGDNNPFNVFLNPGNISSTNATETQKELYKLYQDTKDKTLFPAQAPYSISGGGEKVTLSSQDRADYQKTSGQFVSENLEALFDSEYYKTLDNDRKAEVVNEIVTDANTLAKGEYLETKASKELKEKLIKLGDIPYVEYYNAWSATRGIESDKNWKGGSKKKKQIQAINNATSKNLTNKQRETLYGLLNVSGY